MSKFDGLNGVPVTKNKFEGLNGVPVNRESQQQDPGLGSRIASGAKSIVSGATGAIPDTAAALYNIPAMAHNVRAQYNKSLSPELQDVYKDLATVDPQYAQYLDTQEAPMIPSATAAISKGIDTLSGGYTKTPDSQKDVNAGLEFGAAIAGPGALGKAATHLGKTAIAKAASYIGTTNPWQVGAAGLAGGVMSNKEGEGASTLDTLGTGAAVNIGVANIPNIAKSLARTGFSLAGLGKKNLDVNAVKAANDLDITLPKAVASNGKLVALADQFLAKAPIAGELIHGRYETLGKKVIKNLDEVYDSVINAKELEGVDERISLLYDKSRQMLPKEATIYPKHTIDAIEEIEGRIKTAIPSDDEKTLMGVLSELKEFAAPSNIKNIPAPVEYLIGSKKSLNSTIKWDQDEGVKNMLRELQSSLKEDIAEYGKINKDWYEYYSGADKLFGKVAKRKQLQDMLTGKAVNPATGELSYNSLSKIINNEKTAAQLKRLVEPEIYTKLQKLGTVAKAVAIKSKNIPNPSGTAATQKILYALTGAATWADPVTTGLTLIGSTATAHLLTDKASLNAAIRFIETGEKNAALTFNKRMREITGYTPITLLREVNKEQTENKRD